MNLAEVVADSAEKLSKYGICEANLEAEVLIRMVMDIDKATFFRDLRGDVSVSEQKKNKWSHKEAATKRTFSLYYWKKRVLWFRFCYQ